jgi:pimeloyl-ACP methyl ester carboxylesterase
MLTEKTFDTGEVALNYAEGPASGPPLLLLHGISSRWQSFLAMIPVLTLRWHVYALDFRGHGRSGRANGRYVLEDYARDVVAFIESQIEEPPALYGHSLGGMVGIMVAARRPLRALVVGDSPLYRDSIHAMYGSSVGTRNPLRDLIHSERSVPALARALREMMPDREPSFYRYHAKSCSQLDPDILVPIPTILDGYDGDALLPRIACPVLILQVDHISDADSARALSQLPDGTVARFESLSHELQNEPRGYPVVLAVAKFLESL